MNPAAWQQLTWDVARVGGFVAYGLMLASVVFGLTLSLQWRSERYPRFVTTEVHRFVTLLAIVFTAIHAASVAVDPFAHFTPAEVLVPLVSHYRPVWMALGIVAAYLLLAVHLSERVRGRIGYAAWRRLHFLAFVVYALATLHGLATGSDSRAIWAVAIYGGGVLVVGALTALRLLPIDSGLARHPWIGAALTAGAAGAILWATLGPLAPGWAAAAGGTAAAGSGAAGRAAAAAASAVPVDPIGLPFQASLVGTVRQSGGASGSIAIDAALGGTVKGHLTATIPLGGDQAAAPLTVTVDPSGATCSGELTSARNNVLRGTCSLPDGRVLNVAMRVGLDESGALTGTVQVSNVRDPAPAVSN
jgi:DMSO/TMAO reductase YedYZ heme-binding membrane subunit